MADLSDRQRAYEAEFEIDLERRFRVANRRNRLLGLWVAEAMGMPAAEAEAYARTLIAPDLADCTRQEAVHDRVYADLHGHGVDLSDHRLRRKMERLMAVARDQIRTEDEASGRADG